MLDTYKSLEANGVIGKMMKVNSAGQPIIDPKGELPGQLISRPHTEYPKVIRRQRPDGVVLEKIVNSKSEELKLIAEAPDLEEVRSPLERERDSLAQTVAEQDKALSAQQAMMEKMTSQMTALMAQMEKLGERSGEAKEASPSPGEDSESRATRGFPAR